MNHRHISERAWQTQVTELAHIHGWQTYHTHRSDHSAEGWPDLVLCRPPRLIVAELKTAAGKLTEPQQIWLTLLDACDIEVYVWRPDDLDEVAAVLKGQPRGLP